MGHKLWELTGYAVKSIICTFTFCRMFFLWKNRGSEDQLVKPIEAHCDFCVLVSQIKLTLNADVIKINKKNHLPAIMSLYLFLLSCLWCPCLCSWWWWCFLCFLGFSWIEIWQHHRKNVITQKNYCILFSAITKQCNVIKKSQRVCLLLYSCSTEWIHTSAGVMSTAKKRKKKRSFRFMVAVDQRRSRRPKWARTVWQLTHALLKIYTSTLTFGSPGVFGIHPCCWFSVIDFNCALEFLSFMIIIRMQNAAHVSSTSKEQWNNVFNMKHPSKMFHIENDLNECASKSRSVCTDGAGRLREHICRVNCLFECRLWIHLHSQCKSGYTMLHYLF